MCSISIFYNNYNHTYFYGKKIKKYVLYRFIYKIDDHIHFLYDVYEFLKYGSLHVIYKKIYIFYVASERYILYQFINKKHKHTSFDRSFPNCQVHTIIAKTDI